MELSKRDLFGGAITVLLPKDNLIDASLLREVPDTQEVFLHADSTVSWVIEVLQRVEPEDPSDAAKFHFESLAHDNDAEQSEITAIVPPNTTDQDTSPLATPAPVICSGWQRVAKYNRSAPDKVEIKLALYRLPVQKVDLVLSVNLPHVLADGTVTPQSVVDAITAAFESAANSLHIVDFGLFV